MDGSAPAPGGGYRRNDAVWREAIGGDAQLVLAGRRGCTNGFRDGVRCTHYPGRRLRWQRSRGMLRDDHLGSRRFGEVHTRHRCVRQDNYGDRRDGGATLPGARHREHRPFDKRYRHSLPQKKTGFGLAVEIGSGWRGPRVTYRVPCPTPSRRSSSSCCRLSANRVDVRSATTAGSSGHRLPVPGRCAVPAEFGPWADDLETSSPLSSRCGHSTGRMVPVSAHAGLLLAVAIPASGLAVFTLVFFLLGRRMRRLRREGRATYPAKTTPGSNDFSSNVM